ncbi:MAG: hypothetical protein LBS31_02180 [Candidatus Adiutrix sp.]|nr:hypothetical protein [Candidatus Adiutrix sp.]
MPAAAFLAAAALLAAPRPAGAAPDPDPAPAARRALEASRRSLDLQTEFPADDLPDLEWLRFDWAPGGFLDGFAEVLLCGAGLVVLAVVVMALRNSLGGVRRPRRDEAAEKRAEPAAAAAGRMDAAQLEADELARAGNFAQAMHILLLRSVNELRRRLDVAIAASLTSREILRGLSLGAEARAAFADIIGRVEISYFGAHEPGAEEYAACRRSFENLTLALRKGGPA